MSLIPFQWASVRLVMPFGRRTVMNGLGMCQEIHSRSLATRTLSFPGGDDLLALQL